MTTTIKVTSHNYPALVLTTDKVGDGEGSTTERVLLPEDGEVVFHCTTTRAITIVDLEYDDPRIAAARVRSAA